MNPASLTTDHLLLRGFFGADWQAVHEYASDPEVVRYMEWGPNTEEESRIFVRRAIAGQRQEPRRDCGFAIVLRTEEKLIGGCGVFRSKPDSREGWLGYCLNRRFWGRGYATEAAAALLAFGFRELKLHRIFATCDVANAASARVMEKVGMAREGRLREHKQVKGKWRDSYVYAILVREWGRAESGSAE